MTERNRVRYRKFVVVSFPPTAVAAVIGVVQMFRTPSYGAVQEQRLASVEALAVGNDIKLRGLERELLSRTDKMATDIEWIKQKLAER